MPVGAFVEALYTRKCLLESDAPIIHTYVLLPVGILLLEMGVLLIAVVVGDDAIDGSLGSVRFTVGTLDEWHGLGHLVRLSLSPLNHLDVAVVLTQRTVRL